MPSLRTWQRTAYVNAISFSPHFVCLSAICRLNISPGSLHSCFLHRTSVLFFYASSRGKFCMDSIFKPCVPVKLAHFYIQQMFSEIQFLTTHKTDFITCSFSLPVSRFRRQNSSDLVRQLCTDSSSSLFTNFLPVSSTLCQPEATNGKYIQIAVDLVLWDKLVFLIYFVLSFSDHCKLFKTPKYTTSIISVFIVFGV